MAHQFSTNSLIWVLRISERVCLLPEAPNRRWPLTARGSQWESPGGHGAFFAQPAQQIATPLMDI